MKPTGIKCVDRGGNMGPMVAGTLIFATIAIIGLLVFAYQYDK